MINTLWRMEANGLFLKFPPERQGDPMDLKNYPKDLEECQELEDDYDLGEDTEQDVQPPQDSPLISVRNFSLWYCSRRWSCS